MPDRLILDASVAAKFFYEEANRAAALDLAGSGVQFVVPDLIFLEFASLSARKVRRGEVRPVTAEAAIASLTHMVDDVFPAASFVPAAYELAVAHGFSVYDAIYLVLAETVHSAVITGDLRLVARAATAGLGSRVQAFPPSP